MIKSSWIFCTHSCDRYLSTQKLFKVVQKYHSIRKHPSSANPTSIVFRCLPPIFLSHSDSWTRATRDTAMQPLLPQSNLTFGRNACEKMKNEASGTFQNQEIQFQKCFFICRELCIGFIIILFFKSQWQVLKETIFIKL